MHKEANFEQEVADALVEHGGYHHGNPKEFKADIALFSDEVIAFVQRSQPKFWDWFSSLNKEKPETILLESLVKELEIKGMLTVLRDGFKCFGQTVRAAYFAPNTGMNPEAQKQYDQNRLTVTRQVITQTGAIPDLVLAVNGLPVVNIELKNAMSGQKVEDAQEQYRYKRNPKELLFTFKKRCLVHFAVETDEVYMTTQLEGKETFYLPFNRGYRHGAGNPPVEGDVRTSYLWREVLTYDSLLDILARYLHLQVEERTIATEKGLKHVIKETMIFPRYHQLSAVRRLEAHAKAHGPGHNYLIQHSAGSGKSNSIAWLAHRLSTLHNAHDEKVFHTVVVITDRRVLDRQLQDTIYQFEHKAGVVEKIDENTQQLAKALSDGVPIVITTIQKFPFIAQAIDTLAKKKQDVVIDTAGKRFAVIVDEAHSSQSGETAMELRKILNRDGIESTIAAQILDIEESGGDASLSKEARKNILHEQLKRTKQPNLSYFAFTATPKYKTLTVFDEPGEDGKSPFHRYSMRQAIEEGFILDVLDNYTTYQRYYELVQQVEDDPEVPRRKAARALARFVDMHDYNIAQKVEVIVEHFRTHTRHRIGGRAKAMVVTSSREHAVRYKLGFDRYLKERGYTDIKTLVAFSGDIHLNDHPGHKFTEVGMNNGISETELPKKFNTEEYQILLVAEKYQTGFDQPKLCAMYVDKKLAGLQAVQTLSRLNRMIPGKDAPFVLDFVNDAENIYRAFKPYYDKTELAAASNPAMLDKLKHELDQVQVYHWSEVEAFAQVFYKPLERQGAADHAHMQRHLQPAVDRFKAIAEEAKREEFRAKLSGYVNVYAFLSQIVPYADPELESLYSYGRFLLPHLPRDRDTTIVKVGDEVALQYYRLERVYAGAIDLREGEAQYVVSPTDVGTGKAKDEKAPLSEIIEVLNERFGTQFSEEDRLFFQQIKEKACKSEHIVRTAMANPLDKFELGIRKLIEDLMIERMGENDKIVTRYMADQEFQGSAFPILAREIFDAVRSKAADAANAGHGPATQG
ncbi:MAG: type I restriction endonuclease subunit R [Caldilineaceae bacterium]|nr:type I restriction endonuclease subunit R [Caldilineaceae bacterium]